MTAPVRPLVERRSTAAVLVVELVDRFLRDRRTAGPHPRARGPVSYRIVATETGGVRTDLDDPLDMVMRRNTAGQDLWFGAVSRADGRETWRLPEPFPAVVVRIGPERYQGVEAVFGALPITDRPQRFVLEPSWRYEFPSATTHSGGVGPTLLRGTLRLPDGTGIADASVRVLPLLAGQAAPAPEYRTDATGNWALAFADTMASTTVARVQITPAGGPVTVVPEVRITRGDTSALRQASLAGSARGASGAALPGVVVTVDLVPGLSTTSGADGRWELWLPPEAFPPSDGEQQALVTATRGAGAPQAQGARIVPRATAPVPPFVFG